mmetsp:Transcript_13779/g.15116  ORF Transcript_13779/g.15116 Transcript_13779/m.15116 type:complete len:123 (-) Transcript_13779:289-657(-)
MTATTTTSASPSTGSGCFTATAKTATAMVLLPSSFRESFPVVRRVHQQQTARCYYYRTATAAVYVLPSLQGESSPARQNVVGVATASATAFSLQLRATVTTTNTTPAMGVLPSLPELSCRSH